MASSSVVDERSLRPPSVLEVQDHTEQQRECLSHVLYVATATDTAKVEEIHHKVVGDLLQQSQDSGITGTMLVQDGVILHYYEAAPPASIALLRFMDDCRGKEIDSCRILTSSEDCDRRYFSDWTSHRVEIDDEGAVVIPESTAERDEEAELACDLLSSLMDVAKGKGASSVCPSRQRLKTYAGHDGFFALNEYLELFDTSPSGALESEKAWPYNSVIDYNTVV